MYQTYLLLKLKKDSNALDKSLLLHFLEDDKLTIDEAREKAMNRRKEILRNTDRLEAFGRTRPPASGVLSLDRTNT